MSGSVDLRKMIWPTGGTGEDLAGLLEKAGYAASDACNGGQQAIVDQYLSWASAQVRMLQPKVSGADLSRLVTTPRYWATVGNPMPSASTVSALVEELTRLSRELGEAAAATRAAVEAWRLVDGRYSSLVVIDTNFWIEHSESFSAIDWHQLVTDSTGPGRPARGEELRLVVPIVVIDELDGLTHKASVRAKASGAANWIYTRLGDSPDLPATIVTEVGGQGSVTIQLVFDPPSHVRRSINDEELIERAIVYRDFLGIPERQTFMLTYDTGAAFRATSAGLMPRRLPRA